ncbi:polysaccharide deacetylase family protein [Lederbergia citrea]|uniref:Polysaccharide deacetylase family protein n=1 Tax=Lederbergia citrea TaxID=2833581 RepID=A0A942Z413_9BACI|nr:polysaccharide deacetylase family protein [Lederbergia citrea]MBS4176755.1 polysaccharide deacetylase family protein [Lederbergia citrea]MBS4203316.1 polysaccharide deacetylase family protein [Lederbergia citrea]MBS4222012.1 polysaccharide deacetylase family protein [Lederbergia citrea]
MNHIGIKVASVFILLFSIASHTHAGENKGRAYYEESGDVVWDVVTEEKLIALTFDDGPHSTFTPQILDILAKYNAKATFFVIGEHAKKFPNIIKRQVKEGHEIANHSFTHYNPIKKGEALKKELRQTDDILYKITGTKPAFYRPVGGYYNDQIINTSVHEGYRVIMWSWHQDTEDWKRPGVNKIVSKVLSGHQPGDVVLFHDAGGDRSQTVKALSIILPALEKEGYEFVTVSQLLQRTGIDAIPGSNILK